MPGSKPKKTKPNPEAGVVLVLVLVVLLSLSAMVLEGLERSSTGVIASASLLPEYEAGFKAEAGLSIAVQALALDRDQYADTPSAEWAKPINLKGLHIEIIPCNARINLNLAAEERTEQALLTLIKSPKRKLLVTALQCWLDTKLVKKLPLFSRPSYSAVDPSYSPRSGELTRPEELLLVDGFRRASVDWIRQHFTVWGEGRLNLNFAPRTVLEAYLPELAPLLDQVIQYRQTHGFSDISQLIEATGLSPENEDYQTIINYATVSSNKFAVMVTAKNGGCVLQKRYILQRNPMLPEEQPKLICQDELHVALSGI